MFNKKTFGERIKIAADSVGGLNKLADLTGIPRRTLTDQISPKADPKLSILIKINEITGYSIHWLATGIGNKFIQNNILPFPASDSASAIDSERIEAAIKTVEDALDGYLLNTNEKAELITIAYDMLGEKNGREQFGKIIQLMRAK